METHEKEDALRALKACRNVISSIKNEDHMIGRTDLELMVINLNNTIQRLELSSIGGEEKTLPRPNIVDIVNKPENENKSQTQIWALYILALEKHIDSIESGVTVTPNRESGEPNTEEDLGKR